VKVDYQIEDLESVLEELRETALRILQSKKAALEHAGLHVRLVQVGEKYGSVYPVERYAQYTAFHSVTAPSVSGTEKKGQPVQVQYNYADKSKTIYYERVGDKQFDKVINPVVGEPEVQVFLTTKAQYMLYDPEKEALEKEYNSKMRALNIREKELAIELENLRLKKETGVRTNK
jgi:hypothetical protein